MQLIPKVGGGRCVATEFLIANSAIRNHIREGKTYQIPNTMATSKKIGMHLMDDSIYDLYVRGKISAEHALSYALDRETMERKMF